MTEKIKSTSDNTERAIIVGLVCRIFNDEENSSEESMKELAALVKTAGGEVIISVIQNRASPDPQTFIGTGKLTEIAELAKDNDADLIVFDNELSPSQFKAIEKITECRVLDRSGLILDIFAGRAKTAEGKLQVELAQYKYLLPRLTGMWGHLVGQTSSGAKSPIGTRGPGETQLETDRRRIREHMLKLEHELKDVMRIRYQQRAKREKREIPLVAVVGYTNAGKSTLINALTGSGIEANNRLFDTLDTTTRKLKVSDNLEVLISDTVGFIRRLPTHLIEAFKATLEELSYADLILHVVDISNPEWPSQADITERLCDELAGESVPRLAVFNKADACPPENLPVTGILISAKTGENLRELLNRIDKALTVETKKIELMLPYNKAAILNLIHNQAKIEKTEYTEEGILVSAVANEKLCGRLKEYLK